MYANIRTLIFRLISFLTFKAQKSPDLLQAEAHLNRCPNFYTIYSFYDTQAS